MGHSNEKYTSNHIQNEILEVLAGMVRKDAIEEVKESGVFSILISLVLRYYYRGTVHEGFKHLPEQCQKRHAFFLCCSAFMCFCQDPMSTRNGRTYSAQCVKRISLESYPDSVILDGLAGIMPIET